MHAVRGRPRPLPPWSLLLLGMLALAMVVRAAHAAGGAAQTPLWPDASARDANGDMIPFLSSRRRIDAAAAVPAATESDHSDLQHLQNWQQRNVVLLAAADGNLYCLDRQTGTLKWTLRGYGELHTSFAQRDASEPATMEWLIEPVGEGQLYMFDADSGLHMLPIGVKSLVNSSPFYFSGNEKVLVGKRDSSMLSIDLDTGHVLREVGTHSFRLDLEECTIPEHVHGAHDDGECRLYELHNEAPLLGLGLARYTITIVDDFKRLWNSSYTEWTTSVLDGELERQNVESADGLALTCYHSGAVVMSDRNSNIVWSRMFQAPVLQAFDVFESHQHASSERVVLRNPWMASRQSADSSGAAASVYVGIAPQGGLYALSESHFPSVKLSALARWYSYSRELQLTRLTKWLDDLVGKHFVGEVERSDFYPLLIDAGVGADGLRLLPTSAKARRNGVLLFVAGAAFSMIVLSFLYALFRAPASPPRVHFDESATEKREERLQKAVAEAAGEGDGDEEGEEEEEAKENAGKPLDGAAPADGEGQEDRDLQKLRKRRGARGRKNRKGKSNANEVDAPAEEPKGEVADDAYERRGQDGEIQLNGLIIYGEVLGSGSNGTFVYKGRWEGREIAVKRMLRECVDIALHEVKLLQQSDEHPNIVRYYCTQQTPRFVYMALEQCLCSLHDWIERPLRHVDYLGDVSASLDAKEALYQITSGVKYIHSLKLVHRDIKPGNILVAYPKQQQIESTRKLSIRISDMGLSKKLDLNQSSFGATTAHAAGTSGWRAPELLTGKLVESDADESTDSQAESSARTASADPGVARRATQAIDIFAMGCVFYYILTGGQHPYGNQYLREGNIIKDEKDLSELRVLGEEGVLAIDLIGQMLQYRPELRPRAGQVQNHPFFWSAAKKLSFLMEISDRFETEPRDPPSELVERLETNAAAVLGPDYHKRLDRCVVENLGKYRKYDGKKVLDLLRALRNKRHHYLDLPANVRATFGSIPDGFSHYFTSRFPLLVLHTWTVARDRLADEPHFAPYFSDNERI